MTVTPPSSINCLWRFAVRGRRQSSRLIAVVVMQSATVNWSSWFSIVPNWSSLPRLRALHLISRDLAPVAGECEAVIRDIVRYIPDSAAGVNEVSNCRRRATPCHRTATNSRWLHREATAMAFDSTATVFTIYSDVCRVTHTKYDQTKHLLVWGGRSLYSLLRDIRNLSPAVCNVMRKHLPKRMLKWGWKIKVNVASLPLLGFYQVSFIVWHYPAACAAISLSDFNCIYTMYILHAVRSVDSRQIRN